MRVKLTEERHRLGCAIQVLRVHVGDVPAALEQGQVRLRLVSEKLGAPDPRPARSRRFRRHDEARATCDDEVEPGETMPWRELLGGPGGIALRGVESRAREREPEGCPAHEGHGQERSPSLPARQGRRHRATAQRAPCRQAPMTCPPATSFGSQVRHETGRTSFSSRENPGLDFPHAGGSLTLRMAKVYFYYAAMNAGKSTVLL